MILKKKNLKKLSLALKLTIKIKNLQMTKILNLLSTTEKHYNFLETLAESVFDELFKDKRIAKIMLKIEKLEILKQCSSVGIQITKKRSHDKF